MSEGYQYDSVGNRLKGQGDYFYDNNNRLISITDSTVSQTYTYDNNGSRITKTDSTGVTNYTYDYDNRLKRIDFTDSSYAEYTYDALGRRIKKKIFSLESEVVNDFRYCYDGEDIIAVLDGNNNAIASITHGPGIDHPLAYRDVINDSTYYYHHDYLGSITSITDGNQNVVASAKYDAFGNLLTGDLVTFLQGGQGCSGALVYAYTGREYDSESGLYFYRARYYDSKVGRFLESDPIGFLGGINFYAYVGNCPVNFVDPWGWDKKKKSLEETLFGFILSSKWHFDYSKAGERLIHIGKYRFNKLGELVEHTGEIIGKAKGGALKALEYLKNVKPGYFRAPIIIIIITPELKTNPMSPFYDPDTQRI